VSKPSGSPTDKRIGHDSPWLAKKRILSVKNTFYVALMSFPLGLQMGLSDIRFWVTFEAINCDEIL